jgi:hypothetical protein
LKPRASSSTSADALFALLTAAGEDLARLRGLLAAQQADDTLLLELLRRPVPVRLLEIVGTTPPWSERRLLLGAVALNPRTPRPLGLRLVPSLYWRDLADVAASPRLTVSLRARAEAELIDMVPELRLGERITLARIATPRVLALLLEETEPHVAETALANPRLREDDLLRAMRQDTAPVSLLEKVSASRRWLESYAVRLGLVLQPRTPLPVALAQISSLLPRDLRRVAASPNLQDLIRIAAERLADNRGPR